MNVINRHEGEIWRRMLEKDTNVIIGDNCDICRLMWNWKQMWEYMNVSLGQECVNWTRMWELDMNVSLGLFQTDDALCDLNTVHA